MHKNKQDGLDNLPTNNSEESLFDFEDSDESNHGDDGSGKGNNGNGSDKDRNKKPSKGGQALIRVIYITLLALCAVVLVLLFLQYKTSKELATLSQGSPETTQTQPSPPVTSNIIFQAIKGVLMDIGGSNNDIVISKLDANQTPPVVWVDITLRSHDAEQQEELRHTFISNLETLLLPTGVTINDKGFQIEVRGPEYTIILLLKDTQGVAVVESGLDSYYKDNGDIGEYSNITDDMLAENAPSDTPANEALMASFQRFANQLPPATNNNSLIFVIDDCGYSNDLTTRVVDINQNLTIAVIPFLEYSVSSAEIARNNGNPLFLHLPMEPYHDAPIMNDLDNRLMVNMTPEDWAHLATISAENIGQIDGFNNHEGSYFTEGEDRMSVVLQTMAPFTSLFLDSRTSSKSVAYDTCKGIDGYSCASNNWYLDNNNDYDYIFNQTLGLASSSQRRKDMVTIAHCRAKTVDALELAIPLLVQNGYHLGTVPLVATKGRALEQIHSNN